MAKGELKRGELARAIIKGTETIHRYNILLAWIVKHYDEVSKIPGFYEIGGDADKEEADKA